MQIDFVDENASTGKISLGLSTIVRVTLRDGTFHEDTGYGHIENCKGKAAAFEKAKKESATDALKRALKTFGNVLGNCLYDKDYLARVTKVKVAPSKWDSENLHRHPDYAPVKPRSIEDAESKPIQRPPNTVARNPSVKSNGSFGSAEFEEDYGGDLFADTDFSHPDEVQLDASMSKIETPGPRPGQPQPGQQQQNGQNGQQRQGPSRMNSMPQLRPPNIQQPQQPQNIAHPQKPSAPQRPPMNAAQGFQGAQHRMSAPQTPGHLQKAPQPAMVNNGQHPESFGTRSHSSSGDTADYPATHGLQAQQTNGDQREPFPAAPPDMAPPQHVPADAPQGFVSGRGTLNAGQNGQPPNQVPAFNPHAESPSIRRTHGLNPGKSVPISRDQLNGAARNGAPAGQPPQQHNSPMNGGSGDGHRSGPVQAVRNTNFVNPSADVNRRIGMPPGSGAQQNRGAYRPPSNIKRPALSDVSNMQQLDGAGDAKKAKVESAQPDAGGEMTAADAGVGG